MEDSNQSCIRFGFILLEKEIDLVGYFLVKSFSFSLLTPRRLGLTFLFDELTTPAPPKLGGELQKS